MLKLPVYNLEGEKVGETELNPKIFSEKFRPALIWQVLTSMQANRHFPWAHTKTRGEVRGGGAKPWRQKGTGRARHGSIRSPIWRGGGVTFGPRKEKNYSKKIPKKMRRKALFSALSQKLKDGEIKIVDQWQLPEIKTIIKPKAPVTVKAMLKPTTEVEKPYKKDRFLLYFSLLVIVLLLLGRKNVHAERKRISNI